MREHKTAICHPWFAGASLISSGRSKIGLKEKKTIKEARKALDSYLKNGKLSDALIKKTLRLATLETFKRSWMPGIFLDFRISAAHLEDLRNLLSIYDKRPFQPTNYLELNPSFGRATDAIGGADADLICDNTIFDIKTSKNLEIDRDDFNRQVVYYLLNKLDSGGQPRPKITNLGFYFARYGVFVNYKIEDIIIEEKYKYFMGWFKKNIRWRFYR